MVICLAGMHRSGTSLFSSYLMHNGINMGEVMAKAGHGNKYGHFEDRKFLDFHKDILKKNRQMMYKPLKNLIITDQQVEYARSLIRCNNKKYDAWGWKDPRTTLFLDFWNDIEPDIKYIFLYREPYLVIDSLFRRKGEIFFYFNPLLAADAWCLYNEKVLQFAHKHPDKCVIVSISGINQNSESAISKISSWLGMELSKPYSDVYHPSDISKKIATRTRIYKPIIDIFRSKRIESVYRRLEEVALVGSQGS